MILHTDHHDDARPRVEYHGCLVRACTMTALNEAQERKGIYVASALLTPWGWLKGEREKWWRKRRHLFKPLDIKLRKGASAGKTFNTAKNVKCRQNRLDLLYVPAEWLPRRLRAKVDGNHDNEIWRIEIYGLGGLLTRLLRRFGQYGVFAEFAPASVTLPERVSLGSRWVWWLAGRPHEYVYRLAFQDENGVENPYVLEVARSIGKTKARLLLPLLLVLATVARKKDPS